MSTILVNTLTGTSTAGSIAVTGEGNSTTTNLQQGLCKAWLDHTQITTSAVRDSLNISSITDAATGRTYPISFTNNMSNNDYAGSFYTASTTLEAYSSFNNAYAGGLGSKATSDFGHASYSTSDYVDSVRNDDAIFGDLA